MLSTNAPSSITTKQLDSSSTSLFSWDAASVARANLEMYGFAASSSKYGYPLHTPLPFGRYQLRSVIQAITFSDPAIWDYTLTITDEPDRGMEKACRDGWTATTLHQGVPSEVSRALGVQERAGRLAQVDGLRYVAAVLRNWEANAGTVSEFGVDD